MLYAEIAVNASVKGTFHYHIPPELENKVAVGHLVRVSFGTAMQPGIVLSLLEETHIEVTKPIIELLDPLPVITENHIRLAKWMSKKYLAPIGVCLWLMLPPGITGKSDKLVTLTDPDIQSEDSLEQAIIELLKKQGAYRLSQIRRRIRNRKTEQTIQQMEKLGMVSYESVLSLPTVKPKTRRVVALAIPPQKIPFIARHLGKYSAQANLLEVIAANYEDPIPIEDALKIAGTSRGTLTKLVDEGYVFIEKTAHSEPDLIFLEIPRESVDEVLIDMRGGDDQLQILQFLADEPHAIPEKQIRDQFQISKQKLNKLEEAGIIHIFDQRVLRDSLADRDFAPDVAPMLTTEQQQTWQAIEKPIKAWMWHHPQLGNDDSEEVEEVGEGEEIAPPEPYDGKRAFLLHGVTGSGKTEIYLKAIELALAQGRNAIFLVPEIALTPQTIKRVAERFPGQVAVVHGSLRQGERYDTWHRARTGEISVVVGTRSALFTPLPDVGIIVIDEEHDNSYKQSPPFGQPYYDARDVAGKLMELNEGVVIFGSATPDVRTMHRAEQGTLQLLRLPNRIMGHRIRVLEQSEREGVEARYHPITEDAVTIDLPPVKVIDMRNELKSGNTDMFSRDLKQALGEVLARGEQAILFLNRRGQSTYVFCRDCGTVVVCPRCDTSLTYHHYGDIMRCHHCGYTTRPPTICDNCKSRRIRYFGAGTQEVEAELLRHFPDTKFIRWDADTANKPEMHEEILSQFINHEVDVMIGTQMIAKGLDLPLVTLVGVISADLSLALPDFRSGERAFQLLTQVAGRAGRGLLGGQVILQTYQPDHYAIQAASFHDYENFYRQEIAYRRNIGYPPFRRLARLLFRYTNPQITQREAYSAAEILYKRIEKLKLTGTELIGPVPCFFEKIDKHYRWHILLRSPDPTIALKNLEMRRGWHLDIDPVDIL